MISLQATVEIHDELNPKIWDENNNLYEDVREKLLEVVDEFASSIDVPLTIIDAHIVGSNASYNYTEYSDLDLHCIVNFSRIDADPTITQAWLWSQKKIFNDEYDISVHGVNVEIYVEDIKSAAVSNGIYSLFDNRWIKFPESINIEIDDKAIDDEVEALIPVIEEALNSNDLEEIEDTIDNLYLIRKNGLASDGEYGVGNQTFKELRNLGYLDALNEAMLQLKSEELSII